MIHLNDHLTDQFPNTNHFDLILALDGETFRRHKHRRTFRCSIGGQSFFVKIHRNAGWREVLKNRLRGRDPIVTADPEVHAIMRCHEIGVPTVRIAGHGTRGSNPAAMESFIITEELAGFVHLDEFIDGLSDLPSRVQYRLRVTIIEELAAITRSLHVHGMNHRDLYLCHFMLPSIDTESIAVGESLNIHVIDLHRVQMRRRVPVRWVVKDLSGLLFSAMGVRLTSRDIVRFLRAYWGDEWRNKVRRQHSNMRAIRRRAVRLYQDERGKLPELPTGLASF